MKMILEAGQKPSNWLRCICGNLSDAYCICEGEYDTQIHDYEPSFWTISYYKILRCPSCKQITILRYVTYGSDFDCNDYDGLAGSEPPDVKYTEEILYVPPRKRHRAIPVAIADVVNEAEITAPHSPRAAFILCRAALEEICREHSIEETSINSKGKEFHLSLYTRLKILFERENLSSELQEIMNGIKELGNTGAHGSQISLADTISAGDVESLLDLLGFVLDRLYVDKARSVEAFEKLKDLKHKVLKTN
jgi:hypothetical protein